MLTELRIRNLKRFPDATIPLGGNVVFVGPNNSGKTTALQALALWDFGLRRWLDARGDEAAPEKRPGIALNRKDLAALPVPAATLLWRNRRISAGNRPILIEITVAGVTGTTPWTCGFEFEYANEESFRVRTLRTSDAKNPPRMPVPAAAGAQRIVLLPPMSGLATVERRIDVGAIDVSLGEGRSAEVLRNLCHLLHQGDPTGWRRVRDLVRRSFAVELDDPEYIAGRGEIELAYRDPGGARLDITSAGRGLQQTILLLAHLHAHPRSVLLLDEPDAHLEVIRQKEIYDVLTKAAKETGSQIIAASHSEVLLNEAADRDVVVAFLGSPHRIDDRGFQLAKALKHFGSEQYLQAAIKGWVLYLEGATDRAVLAAFAETLAHPAAALLRDPFARYVDNLPSQANDHFFALRAAKPDLVGVALFDRLDASKLGASPFLRQLCWSRREIENYLAFPSVLLEYARSLPDDAVGGPLFAGEARTRSVAAMESAIRRRFLPAALENASDRWWRDVRASEELLDPLFEEFFEALGLPNLMRKSDYHELASLVPKEKIDPEVVSVLDAIVEVASRAKPEGRDAE